MGLLKGKSKDNIKNLLPSINDISDTDHIVKMFKLFPDDDLINELNDIELNGVVVPTLLKYLISKEGSNEEHIISIFNKYKDEFYIAFDELFDKVVTNNYDKVCEYMLKHKMIDVIFGKVWNDSDYPHIKSLIINKKDELFKEIYNNNEYMEEIFTGEHVLFKVTWLYNKNIFDFILEQIDINNYEKLIMSLVEHTSKDKDSILKYVVDRMDISDKNYNLLFKTAVVRQAEHPLRILINTGKKPNNVSELMQIAHEYNDKDIMMLLRTLK